MGDELGEGADVVERALSVRDSHHAVEKVDRPELTRLRVLTMSLASFAPGEEGTDVVVPVLRTGDGV